MKKIVLIAIVLVCMLVPVCSFSMNPATSSAIITTQLLLHQQRQEQMKREQVQREREMKERESEMLRRKKEYEDNVRIEEESRTYDYNEYEHELEESIIMEDSIDETE